MKITAIVHPNSKRPHIETMTDGVLQVYLKSPAIENKANVELITAIAKHLHVHKSAVIMLQGSKSKQKLIEVLV